MALDAITKIEITAHNSCMEDLLSRLQQSSLMQIDPHSIKNWENEKAILEKNGETLDEFKKELVEVDRSVTFLNRYGPKVSILKKLSSQPLELTKVELEGTVQNENAKEIKDRVISLEKEIASLESSLKETVSKKQNIIPFKNLGVPVNLLFKDGKTAVIISKLKRDAFEKLLDGSTNDLIHIERISGEETVYFYIIYHTEAKDMVEQLEREYKFEPISIEKNEKTPQEILKDHERIEGELIAKRDSIIAQVSEIAINMKPIECYYDYLQTEIEKESAKEKLFYSKSAFVIDGWIRERDYTKIQSIVNVYKEACISQIEREQHEDPPTVYNNNRIISPFELLVNMYSTPNLNEVDPTPFVMIFFSTFLAIALTEGGYGVVITILSSLALGFLKPRNNVRKFITIFLIVGIFSIIIGVLFGTIFGINFDALPENLTWLKEARYKLMIFDSGKDVMTFFALCLGIGIIHLLTGYFIKMYMLFKRGDWVSAICDNLPYVFLLLAPVPKVLIKSMPQNEATLNKIFYLLLGLWGVIILFFSERSTLNPIKRIGKGLFTLYGVTSIFGDVLSYSRLLALGIATGVIAGVVNTLAGIIREIPVIGIVGYVPVLIVGHLFNLGTSTMSGFVHSIRLNFLEFFGRFYTGEGILFQPFAEKRRYTYPRYIGRPI